MNPIKVNLMSPTSASGHHVYVRIMCFPDVKKRSPIRNVRANASRRHSMIWAPPSWSPRASGCLRSGGSLSGRFFNGFFQCVRLLQHTKLRKFSVWNARADRLHDALSYVDFLFGTTENGPFKVVPSQGRLSCKFHIARYQRDYALPGTESSHCEAFLGFIRLR